ILAGEAPMSRWQFLLWAIGPLVPVGAATDAIAGFLRGSQAITAAAEGGLNVEGANFAQRTFSSTFRGGSLVGRSISDVSGDLSSGALTPKDVPVGMIVRDGNSLILNTRSAQALMQAGIPRSAWSVIDQTGDPFFEELLTGQLTRNGLDSSGFPYPTPSGW
ncbi:MAG TPA: hypothetical protein VMV92_04440, partial [Streptosporangiaceae bacterium]|nr:hypothetical protein [Streptosporangiaceae bacterium]